MEEAEVRFMSGPGVLLEFNECGPVAAALTPVWEREVGTRPSYGGDGQNATGYHWPSGPGERTMKLMRPTSDEAIKEAERLIIKKYGLTNVVVQDDEIATPDPDFDWDVALSQPLEEKPYDESAITIWRG
jgi:hypothetical protein